jgi:hypothetical protein
MRSFLDTSDINEAIEQSTESVTCFGYCGCCRKDHLLQAGAARHYCLKLMQLLDEKRRVDLTVPDEQADWRLRTDYLFGPARGQMFGVMVYKTQDGRAGAIPAFSGQYDGHWQIEGWAPPLFELELFYRTTFAVEKEIKKLGGEIAGLAKGSAAQKELRQQRKSLSRELMKEIHALYLLHNFAGKTASIHQAFSFPGKNGIPTGTGDCCAPKLLNYAAANNLSPLGIAEFYWGKENRSGTRQQGQFYPSCQEKCASILGFLLCGLS